MWSETCGASSRIKPAKERLLRTQIVGLTLRLACYRVLIALTVLNRQFAKEKEEDSHLRPAHFNAIMTRAFDAVPPPDDDYWAQLEHVPAAASVSRATSGTA